MLELVENSEKYLIFSKNFFIENAFK